MPNDPRAHSAEDRELRRAFRELDRKREAHYRDLDQMLNAGRQKLDAKQGEAEEELKRKLAKLKQQMADTLAELGDDEPDEPPAQPPLPGQRQLGPEEEAARFRAMPLGSPEHMAARQAHGISKPFVL